MRRFSQLQDATFWHYITFVGLDNYQLDAAGICKNKFHRNSATQTKWSAQLQSKLGQTSRCSNCLSFKGLRDTGHSWSEKVLQTFGSCPFAGDCISALQSELQISVSNTQGEFVKYFKHKYYKSKSNISALGDCLTVFAVRWQGSSHLAIAAARTPILVSLGGNDECPGSLSTVKFSVIEPFSVIAILYNDK